MDVFGFGGWGWDFHFGGVTGPPGVGVKRFKHFLPGNRAGQIADRPLRRLLIMESRMRRLMQPLGERLGRESIRGHIQPTDTDVLRPVRVASGDRMQLVHRRELCGQPVLAVVSGVSVEHLQPLDKRRMRRVLPRAERMRLINPPAARNGQLVQVAQPHLAGIVRQGEDFVLFHAIDEEILWLVPQADFHARQHRDTNSVPGGLRGPVAGQKRLARGRVRPLCGDEMVCDDDAGVARRFQPPDQFLRRHLAAGTPFLRMRMGLNKDSPAH